MNNTHDMNKIFSIRPQQTRNGQSTFLDVLLRPLEHLLGLNECGRIYSSAAHQSDPRLFIRCVLAHMNVSTDLADQDCRHIPGKGPVVVVANHPFGGIEGVLLADILMKVRGDVKIMANFLLNRIPQFEELIIPVDPFNGRHTTRANLKPLRQAVNWVCEGGMLLVFPAGEVSHLSLTGREVSDPPWNSAVATIVRHAKAAVLPIFVHGRNRFLFQTAGLVHPCMRTALLARELINKRNTRIPVKIGAPVSFRWLQRYNDNQSLVDYLRWRTYVLGHTSRPALIRRQLTVLQKQTVLKPVAPAPNPDLFAREIARLPADQILVQSGNFTVWQAAAQQIPKTLSEIGRLREISFRAASEGTGKPLDLDRFDDIYLHLFIWNEDAREIVGAYRLGATDRILGRHGKRGLYTNTLFRSNMAFYQKIGPALEMGRSFIRPAYQKSYAALLLLWKGIGSYISQNPRYRILFGPVSISRDYSDLTRRLIASTLLRHSQAKDLAIMVKPRKPVPVKPVRVRGCHGISKKISFQDFKEVCAVIGDIELQQKEVPVLLRHYLNLGGQLLAFNIDRHFGDVMDGLIVVDLLRTNRKMLQRYLGADGLTALYACHAASEIDEDFMENGPA